MAARPSSFLQRKIAAPFSSEDVKSIAVPDIRQPAYETEPERSFDGNHFNIARPLQHGDADVVRVPCEQQIDMGVGDS